MDEQTIATYNANAQAFAQRYRRTQSLTMRRLAQGFFYPGALTADIGCGSGRDAHWLAQEGYPIIGYDASPAMLEEARRGYPELALRQAALPELAGLPDASFRNVLCSDVLMHLPAEDLITAVLQLARVMQPDGRLILTYRDSHGAAEREDDGRLFTAIPSGKLTLLLEAAGFQLLHATRQADAQRPAVTRHTLVAEKSPLGVARGLERIQGVLTQDRKVATYKLALLRALCTISRTQSHLVRWESDGVYVPLWALAVQWLICYWPLLTHDGFIAQIRGERPTSAKPIAFRADVRALCERYGRAGLYDLLKQLDADPRPFQPALKSIADTMRAGPVTYAGTGDKIFRFAKTGAVSGSAGVEGSLGWVVVPEPIWLDISRFEHWIEDSIVVRWARLTAEMNPAVDGGPGLYLPLLLEAPAAERSTGEVRRLLEETRRALECVWTGQRMARGFDVDHVIAYSVWGNNDLWNLLPALPSVNNQKRDALPTQTLLLRRREAIVGYWQTYRALLHERFERQLQRALGAGRGSAGWEQRAFAGLQETVERLATTRGLPRWEP